MKARELFEIMGFEKTYEDEKKIVYFCKTDGSAELAVEVKFDLKWKRCHAYFVDDGRPLWMYPSLLRAVHRQAQELDWL